MYHDNIENRHADGAVLFKLYFQPMNEEIKKHNFLLGPGWRDSWRGVGLEVGGSLAYPGELVYCGISYPLLKYLDISSGAVMHLDEKNNSGTEFKYYAGLNADITLAISNFIKAGGGLIPTP